jgi:uncharacterized membrane protein
MSGNGLGGRFSPEVHQRLNLFSEIFSVEAHPSVPGMVHASAGSRATVYRLARLTDRRLFALKVFRHAFLDSKLAAGAARLSAVNELPGLEAAARRMVLPSDPIVASYRDLQYAMLIPWIAGTTWFDILSRARAKQAPFAPALSLRLCQAFLQIMSSLESKGLAHTDISPGNVLLDPQHAKVELVDLEEMYFPDAEQKTSPGSSGYRHPNCQNFWRADGDRYAGAILAAEILVLCNPELALLATGEGFFADNATSDDSRQRYVRAAPWLRQMAPDFAVTFAKAWHSDSLANCPSLTELRDHALTAPVPPPAIVLHAQPATPTPPLASDLDKLWEKAYYMPEAASTTPPPSPLSAVAKWTVIISIILALIVLAIVLANSHKEEEIEETPAPTETEPMSTELMTTDTMTTEPLIAAPEPTLASATTSETGNQTPEFSLKLRNLCSTQIMVAIDYRQPNGDWISKGWWMVAPNSVVTTDGITENRYVYFFARNENGEWNGVGEEGAINLPISNDLFIHLDKEAFPLADPQIKTFFRHYIDGDSGEYIQNFTCNK